MTFRNRKTATAVRMIIVHTHLEKVGAKASLSICDVVIIFSRLPYYWPFMTWWRHHVETFCALLALCAMNSPVTGEFPSQRPATRSFDVFLDLRLNEGLSKQSWGWWFEAPSRPLLRHSNGDDSTYYRLWRNPSQRTQLCGALIFLSFSA